jgi:hypothetical protein
MSELPPPPDSTPEFSRRIDIRQVESKPGHFETNEAERAALAKRFGLVRIDSLAADLELTRSDRQVEARGRLKATFIQSCAISAEDLPVIVDEPVFFRFVPAADDHTPDEEVELTADDLDEIESTPSSPAPMPMQQGWPPGSASPRTTAPSPRSRASSSASNHPLQTHSARRQGSCLRAL